jgi:hypothetical protein
MAAGLFIGADGAPSLSLFQIFFWTVIAVWGLVFVYIVTGTLLTMTTSMLALLGIAGTGSVLARWIGVGNTPPGAAAGGATRQSPPKVDMGLMLSTNGSFDLLKLQLFVFTLMIGAYVVWRVMDSGAFPDLDTNTLLLLGVSQGVYIGGKVASTTTIAKARTLKLDLDVQTEALSQRKAERDAKDAAKAVAVQARAAETDPARQQQGDATIIGLTGEIAALNRTIAELQATIEGRKVELQKLYQELGLVA